MPPMSSGWMRRAMLLPKLIPNRWPNSDISKDTMQMTVSGHQSWPIDVYPVTAIDTPTANASMLVAMASSSCVRKWWGWKAVVSSLPCIDSQIIFPPMNSNSVKAIQWPYTAKLAAKWITSSQPISGIRAWKKPKRMLIRTIVFPCQERRIAPLTIETEKQSIASERANKIRSMKLNDDLFYCCSDEVKSDGMNG